MNYDNKQYTFSHGLATAPQLHLQQQLQQHQLHHQQQQQQIFQQQFGQVVPTSNIYQFQFTGGGNPVNQIFQQKDAHQMGISGGMQSRMAPHNIVQQPFIKQGMPVGIDGSSIHVVGGLDGMIYSQPKNDLKLIANPDGRVMQQPNEAIRMQQAFVRVNMMRNSNFTEPNFSAQQNQHQGIRMANQGNMFTYNKQHFSGWLQPQQINTTGTAHRAPGCQSTLPSFNQVWSQFHHPKQIDVIQQQHISQYQQTQQFPNQLQQHMQTQQQFMPQNFQTPANIQMMKIQQHQKPQQIPTSLPVVSHTPQKLNSFSSSEANLLSPNPVGKEVTNTEREMPAAERTVPILSQSDHSLSCIQPSCIEHHPSTAVTYTLSGPPKVTVTLDSLAHSEAFPPNQFPSRSETSFNSQGTPTHFVKGKPMKTPSNITSSLLTDSFHSQPQREWHITQNQRNSCLPKPLVHTSSTGSSLERSSSESSNFSSPPYIFTPPSSADSMFSPVLAQFPKAVAESLSSGRTSALSSSSSAMSLCSSPPVSLGAASQPVNQYNTATTVPSVTAASSMCTTSAATVALSCSSVAMTTTSVMSTTPSPKESLSTVSAHSTVPGTSNSSCSSESLGMSHDLVCKPLPLLSDEAVDKKVKVPYSWQRKFENGVIIYLSPSGVVLQSLDQICRYLLSDTTCKCGLECPIQLEKSFSFDPEVVSQPWSANINGENLGNLCNHRREILALAAFHNSQTEAAVNSEDSGVWLGKKRERRKSAGAGEELIVAPLKRLKTSITNAVNRHALSLGTSASHTPPVMDSLAGEKLHVDLSFQNPNLRASASPSNSAESCSNHGNVSGQESPTSTMVMSRLDSQNTQNSIDGDGKLFSESLHMQKVGCQDRKKQSYHRQQQYSDGQAVHYGSSDHSSLMPVRDNMASFYQGNRRELISNMQSQHSAAVGPHHMMQYPQELTHHKHHHQPTGSGIFVPQNHLYPNMPHLGQPQPQGFHPSGWQPGCPGPASHQQLHHHPRSYQPNAGFQHSDFNQPRPNPPGQQQVRANLALAACTKNKSKRPKSKKDKQKQANSIVDRSSPCVKVLNRPAKPAVIPSTTASFFGNPIVFVEQQAAIINSSIASCQTACPSLPQCDLKSSVTHSTLKDPAFENITAKPCKDNEYVGNDSVEVLGKSKNIDKEEDEDQKTGTDLDSNKSFSDTTENNDSAYLSQTGSDQERSDVADCLDSCPETKSKLADVYDFHPVEEQKKQNSEVSHNDTKTYDRAKRVTNLVSAKNTLTSSAKLRLENTAATGKICNTVTNCSDVRKNTTSKSRQKSVVVKKDTHGQDIELLKKSVPSNLNGDLLQLLASSNWNLATLQQVVAQYCKGDPNQLASLLQQVHSQAGADADFPASNLLSAAARAQLNFKQKKQVTTSVSGGLNPQAANMKTEVIPTSGIGVSTPGDVKAAIASTAVCGTIVSPVVTQQHQGQSSFQQIGNNASLIGNMMHLQQLQTGSFAVNMLLSAGGQGPVYATDALRPGTLSAEAEVKSGQGAINPLMAQGILATVSQTGDVGSQMKLSVASVIPSRLGPHAAHCNPDSSTMLLNSFGPRMIMNAPMPPVSLSVVTNVTKSLAQVVPAIGINQTVFGTPHVTQQLLNAQQSGAQIIGAGTAAPATHMITASPQGTQLVNTAPQGPQFVNPTAQSTQLISSTPQATQLMNALSVQGLNNQLLITNTIQQVSPSNSLSQLSPAVAQILTQGHPQLPQMSPSYLQNQIQKQAQNSVISTQNIFASVSLPPLTVTADSTDVIANSVSQTGIIGSSIQANPQVGDALDKLDIASNMSHVKDTSASLANTSMYAATSQPVFVIPQPNSNPMMQMLGSAQQLSTSSGLTTDLNVQTGSLPQLFGQSAGIDQSLVQNLLTAGFSQLAIQQMMNAVSLSGVQQQQQLQMLQLQQLMLQQLQNHSQNIQGIPLPLSQNSNPNQAATIGAPAIVSAVMPQPGLQLNSLMDVNGLHPCLSPVAQGYQNQLSPAAAQLQHLSSALAVHQVAPANSCAAVGVVQNGGMQNMMPISGKCIPAGHSFQPQQLPSHQVIHTNQIPAVNPSGAPSHESPKVVATQVQQVAPTDSKLTVTANTTVRPSQPTKSKSKSKSKKSESRKIIDSEAERNEEDIAATVQQILAHAVQQQKELSLATKNQPPPPTKSKGKKSQHRAKANHLAKEHDLGRLASISDDTVIQSTEGQALKDKPVFESIPKCSMVLEPGHFSSDIADAGHIKGRQSVNHVSTLSRTVPNGLHSFSSTNTSNPVISNFVEQTLNKSANLVNKKSSLSLKDHLSSIISKDGSGRLSGAGTQKLGKGKAGSDLKVLSRPSPAVTCGAAPLPKTQNKNV